VRNMLGTIDQSAVYEILHALAASNGAEVLAAVTRLAEHAPDYGSALEELMTLLHRIAIAQAVPDAIDNSFGDKDKLLELCALLPAEDVQLFYQLGLSGRRDLPLAPDSRSGLEMALLRMLAFRPAGLTQLPTQKLQNSEANPLAAEGSSAKKSEVAARATVAVVSQSISPVEQHESQGHLASHKEQINTLPPHIPEQQKEDFVEPLPELSHQQSTQVTSQNISQPSALQPQTIAASPVITAPQAITTANEVTAVQSSSVETDSNVRSSIATISEKVGVSFATLTPQNWCENFSQLGFGGVVGSIASHCVLVRVEGDNLYLELDQNNSTLFNDGYTDRIQAHLSVTLNAPVKVIIDVKPVSVETPAQRRERLLKERNEQALVTLQQDENIQILVRDFDAVLEPHSVQPL
jgi:DNA polymerase-3 subunit gamma/tau